MKKIIISVFIVLCISFVFRTKSQNLNFEESPIEEENILDQSFILSLEAGENLERYFAKRWTLIYHEENRCEGMTQGFSDSLLPANIDQIIRLELKNDGQGWACDPKEARTFLYEFNIKELTQSWDRFEEETGNQKENPTSYLMGKGESDYMILHFNADNKIFKLEYHSEDPG